MGAYAATQTNVCIYRYLINPSLRYFVLLWVLGFQRKRLQFLFSLSNRNGCIYFGSCG